MCACNYCMPIQANDITGYDSNLCENQMRVIDVCNSYYMIFPDHNILYQQS